MTLTLNPSANGRKERRSLANELDRLDGMIDGLDKAIPAAVADAVEEAIAPAVAEAFRATIMELISNPDILKLLRGLQGQVPAASDEPAAVAEQRPTLRSRLKQFASSAYRSVKSGLGTAARFTVSPMQTMMSGAIGAYHRINAMWNLRKPVLIALGVGMIVGAAAYASAPWLAGVIAGCSAASTTFLGQFVAWSRRLCASVSLG